ncbi:hypothetical protein Runsl_3123 [Runella slithyformis DSM 19594]|uniref:Uncharacterized protein n=1 Tax=Runella slithyformis (strain ATCC 29530 / DSM 19594 / LMG 11500 / NCIMB 11436 / LSU 4) TaxID=761193 RepID=A0A7U3ZLP1_RUNSL|nr:hypothetical protein Runsl_3123 [Runella slithyformis DSM 19594]
MNVFITSSLYVKNGGEKISKYILLMRLFLCRLFE